LPYVDTQHKVLGSKVISRINEWLHNLDKVKVSTCTCAYIHTYIHACIHTYIHTYIHTIHTYIIHIHTYTYTSVFSNLYNKNACIYKKDANTHRHRQA